MGSFQRPANWLQSQSVDGPPSWIGLRLGDIDSPTVAPGKRLPRRWAALLALTDSTLLRNLDVVTARDRITTAILLAHLAEVDARRLFVPAGFPTMFAYCVAKLGFSEDAA